jgi:hypothetical protein
VKRHWVGIIGLVAVAVATSSVTSAVMSRAGLGRAARRAGVESPGGLTTPVVGKVEPARDRLQAIYEADRDRERGTRVSFNLEEEGLLEDVRLHTDVEREYARRLVDEALTTADPEPAERSAHFGWLEGPGMRRRGWYAVVRDIASGPWGIFVKVRMSPYLVSDRAAVTMTSDYVDEYYVLDPSGLTYLGADEPPADHARAVFGD